MTLRALTRILELFMSEIRYGKAAMPECCGRAAGRMEEPFREGMQDACRLYREGERDSFPDAFCESMERSLRKVPLQREDRELFLQPFREPGFQDGSMQLKCLEQGAELLRDSIRLREKELPGKCRVAMGLGGMGGIFVLLILL